MRILGTGSALPAFTLTNERLTDFLDTSDEWIRTRTGICSRQIMTDENLTKLAREAALRAHGLEPGCDDETFRERVLAGLKEYKRWSEGNMLEAKPEIIWPDYYLKDFNFDREKLIAISEELGNMWEVTYYHRELRPGVKEMLDALVERGYRIGVISNNASLYNVFDVLEDYGIRHYMQDVTVSSVTGYRKPHPEIFRISMRQMCCKPEECVYMGDTVSRDIIGAKRAGFGKAVQIYSFLSAQKDVGVVADAEKPDVVIENFQQFIQWLDEVNPAMAPPDKGASIQNSKGVHRDVPV